MAISSSGEGCFKTMEKMLCSIVESIIPFLEDQVTIFKIIAFHN